MSGLHLIRLSDHLDMMSTESLGIEVYKKYVNGDFEISLYKLMKGSSFFIDGIKQVDGIKTYTILVGQCTNLETKRTLLPGDLLVIDMAQGVLHFDVIEDMIVMIHALKESVFAGWVANEEGILNILSEIQKKDTYTEQHCNNVFMYASKLAEKCGLSSNELYYLNKAARFHDVGKVFIEDAILNKAGLLTQSEYVRMMEHVILGKELICRYFSSEIYDVIVQHHERLDGSGYPRGISGDAISLSGRILAVCDSFDAMTTDRVYKAGKTRQEAIAELRSLGGSKLDAWVVECLIEVLDEMNDK